MLQIFIFISILFTVIAAIGCVYHIFWASIALCESVFKASKAADNYSVPSTRFAIFIPAHNEEQIIKATLESCLSLDYPKEKRAIFVIADNCTDQTASIARSFGVECLERANLTHRGKGRALAWAFSEVLAQKDLFDAVLILDADCTLDAHALLCVDRQIQQGVKAMQLNYIVSNPETSSITFLLAAANKLENDYYYAPKSWFHAAVLLRGTGMAMQCDLMEQFPWNAFSIVEDTEHSIKLLENDVEIRFIKEARVISEFPSENKALTVQRSRWVGGTFVFSMKHGLRLLLLGLLTFRWRIADAGMTLLTLSRPLIMAQFAMAWFVTLLTCLWVPEHVTRILIVSLVLATIGYMAYACLGIFSVCRQAITLKNLLLLPINSLQYLVISIKSMLGNGAGGVAKNA